MMNVRCTCCKRDNAELLFGDHNGSHYLCQGCYDAIMRIRAVAQAAKNLSPKECHDWALIERCAKLPEAVHGR